MAPVQIDLNTRILDKDHNVFVARPGKNYRFYPDFHADAVVFPDLPALGLKDGQTLDTYDDLTERVFRARAVRSWHRRGMPDDDKPSRNLADYKRKKGRSAGQLEGVVRGYFERAAKGDLVVVPPKGYRDPALIGEFLADPKEVVAIKSRFYTREEMSARRVKWLGSIEKRKLIRPVLDALEKPNALFLLEKGFRDDIYEVAYGNYILGDDEFTARFDISSPVFTVDDELLLQSFFKFVAVNVRSIENNQGIFGYRDTVFMPAGDYVPYLQTDIHSPGTLILNCPRLTPLVASIMFALAISVGPQAIELAKADQIVLKNSKAALHDPCTARVREESMQFLRLLELDQWTEACDKAREVEKRTGAQSPSKVK